jgi:outer membrane protein assembly factor BamB
MSSPADLDARLRAAAGSSPDPEDALVEVTRRVRRRARRRGVLGAVAVCALAAGLTAWITTRPDDDPSSLDVVGEPPEESIELVELWTAEASTHAGFAPNGGRLKISFGNDVFIAQGFGSDGQEPRGLIRSVDRRSGDQRWTAELGGPSFLQGIAGGTVIANTQKGLIVGLNAADGSVTWELELSELGLDEYGAVTSALAGDINAIGVSANNEADVRPPVVLGLDASSGELRWRTTLAEGMDLQWAVPAVSDGQAVFTSTLSHPGSAEENVAHLVDLADGDIRWTVGMGGSQGFSEERAVIDGPFVHLPAHPDIKTVDLDGEEQWSRSGFGSASTDAGLWMITVGGPLELVSRDSGELVRSVEAPIAQPSQLIDVGGGRLAVVSHAELAIIDSGGRVELRHGWRDPLVDEVAFDRGMLFAATVDGAVTAYDLEISSIEDGASRRVTRSPGAFRPGGDQARVMGWVGYDERLDCYFLEYGEGARTAVVWPAETVATDEGLRFHNGVVARIGDFVRGGGGTSPADAAELADLFDMPPECAAAESVVRFNTNMEVVPDR